MTRRRNVGSAVSKVGILQMPFFRLQLLGCKEASERRMLCRNNFQGFLSNNFRQELKAAMIHVFRLGAQCSGMAYPMGMDAFGMMGGMGCGMMGVWCSIVFSFARSNMRCCGCMLCTDGRPLNCFAHKLHILR